MLTTSLYLLRKWNACETHYHVLVGALGPKWTDREVLPLARILETNGLDDTLWALRAVPVHQRTERDRLARLFACRCVRETPIGDGRMAWDLLTDPRSRAVVEVAERFVVGRASREELNAARDAAWVAADAAWVAAAWVAAWAANAAAAANAADADAARDAQTLILREMLQEEVR